MGKVQKKTGKGRLDKYYKLAKEQGFRARSAFKLIQLNKRFQFLESSRCCIDLCAAPGGWLQVASKYMPVNSLIVGVDLVPIKPIPKVIAFTADITTPKCRSLLRNHLKDWKADVVLHDGAPNVGTAWVQDAYAQSELVLSSLKLAVEFLAKGGTFVTKVFRSQDYNSLIWVFNQLFAKVEATKPPSSRTVSAEIFVVCTNFLAPTHIDPKFLDPKHVFKDVDSLPPAPSTSSSHPVPTAMTPAATNVFLPDKKRRKREGYADGDYTLFKLAPASEFIYSRSVDPVTFLGSYNKIEFLTEDEKSWRDGPLMTEELRQCCEDLKVLGKRDFKSLLKWRLLLREELGLGQRNKPTEEFTETVEVEEQPVDDDQMIQEELEHLNASAVAKRKREKRKANEKKTKAIQRMQLNMTAPMDIGRELNDSMLDGQLGDVDLDGSFQNRNDPDVEMFDLAAAGDLNDDVSHGNASETGSDRNDDAQESEEEEVLDTDDEQERKLAKLEGALDEMYESYRQRKLERDPKRRAREARAKNAKNDVWAGIRKDDSDSSSDEGEDAPEGEDEGVASEEGGWDVVQRAKDAMDNDSSSDDDSTTDEVDPSVAVKKRKGEDGKASLIIRSLVPVSKPSASKATQVWFSQDVFKGIGDLDNVEDEGDEDKDEDPMTEGDNENVPEGYDVTAASRYSDDFEVVPQADEVGIEWDVNDEDEDRVKARHIKKHGLTTAEAITLAQQLVNRKTTKTHLINDGFNRYSLNSKEHLPDWFLEDERKFYKPNIPITKEAIEMLRAKQRALDARPIKKVAEAKARKKTRAIRRYENAVKKAEGVISQKDEFTEKEKAGAVEKLLRKSMSKEKRKRNEVQVVVAKGPTRGLKGRPKGVKGRYLMVDARGRKELRAKKRKEKANKKRKRA